MQVQIPIKQVNNLRCILSQIQSSEETQQLRIPEPMADIDRILGTWGQVLLRAKEWRDGYITVSGGTMAWVMYLPEGEPHSPQIAQAWLPFQMKWELPRTELDGKIRVLPLLESVDARSASAKKIIVRASVSVLAEAYLEEKHDVFVPEELPEELCLLKKTYPILIPRECGEKIFEMEEDLTLPQSTPAIDEILRFSFHPELIDQKVLSGKVAFRGSGLLHILYRSKDGELCCWDFEIPFAQYDQLDIPYEQDAKCRVLPIVTGLELDLRPDGELRLKAGISGQYMIYDISELTVAEDAYRLHGDVAIQNHELVLPNVLDIKQQTIPVEQVLPGNVSRVLDTAFYPSQCHCKNYPEGTLLNLGGFFSLLYLDENGQFQGKNQRWQEDLKLPAAENVCMRCDLQPSGVPRSSVTSGEVMIKSNLYLDVLSEAQSHIPMITSLEMGEKKTPDSDRPCLILQRMGNTSLWNLAKENGSTVEKIRSANTMEDQIEQDRILLIPVV